MILSSLAKYADRLHPLIFIVTSRPIERVVLAFRNSSLQQHTHNLMLGDIPQKVIEHDIAAYLQASLGAVRDRWSNLDSSWPGPERLRSLVELSKLLFIFAATAVKYIADETVDDPDSQIDSILCSNFRKQPGAEDSPFAHLD